MEDNINSTSEGTQNPEQKPAIDPSKIYLDDNALIHLNETRKWTMFFAILAFVFISLAIIGIIFGSIALTHVMNNNPLFGVMTATRLLFYIPILLLYFFPAYYLYKFSKYSKKALQYKNSLDYSTAMKYLKLHFRFVGILTIILISIYIIILIIFVIFGGFLLQQNSMTLQ